MIGSRERFGNDKPLWKIRRGHLLQFPDHKATEKENSGKNLGKTKEKERAKNQAVTLENFVNHYLIWKINSHLIQAIAVPNILSTSSLAELFSSIL